MFDAFKSIPVLLHSSIHSQEDSDMTGRSMTIARGATQGFFKSLLEDIRAAGTWKAERIITSQQASHIRVLGSDKSVCSSERNAMHTVIGIPFFAILVQDLIGSECAFDLLNGQ